MELKRLCDGFIEYIRLALLHYMIGGWQYFLVGDTEALPYDYVNLLIHFDFSNWNKKLFQMLCLRGLSHLKILYSVEKEDKIEEKNAGETTDSSDDPQI